MPRLSRSVRLDPQAIFGPLSDFRRLALAVSGGPDSLALMLLAHGYAEATASHERFVVYSVDHGLRPEAAGEVGFVLAEAKRRGLAARGLRWEGEKPATGIQEAARDARYALFAEAMREDGADALVTAHHLGDQAETVLMRLAHGSGIEGLRGMDRFATIAGMTIVRPLLGIDPADLRVLVDAAGIEPVTDPSNSDLDYERVRWRQMLPQLAALGLDAQRLGKFAERMRDADRAIEVSTAKALTLFIVADDGSEATIRREELRALPRAVAIRAVSRALDRVGGGRKPHALAAVEALTDALVREPVKTTLHGCLIQGGRTTIRISREGPRSAVRKVRREPTQA